MTVRQLVGDCRVTLPTLEARSVQAAVTSPPYYGLRDYGLPPLVWGGDAACAHAFGLPIRAPWANELPSAKSVTKRNNAFHDSMGKTAGSFCPCGAWLGSLGLEPTPDLYVEHLVEVFRHVRRVLRDDGVLWLNFGDSYAGSGKGPSNSLNKSNPHSHDAAESMKRGLNNLHDTPTQWMPLQRIGPQEHTIGHGRVPGLKPKDLMMIPARAALALQADGWTLRAQLPWVKRNGMPGSERDRPSTSIEYWFLLTKSRRYFWDYDAVRVESSRKSSGNKTRLIATVGERSRTNTHLGSSILWQNDGAGRNWRNSDAFWQSWQGLLVDDDGDPLALVANTAPFKGSHYATFPPKLVEPMIKASTSEKGQCPECGAPWVRVVEREKMPTQPLSDVRHTATGTHKKIGQAYQRLLDEHPPVTTGWQPSCEHEAEPVPQTVLDPFGGAGTVGLVADRLQRNAILCELKPEYADMGADRITGDSPMFSEVEVA